MSASTDFSSTDTTTNNIDKRMTTGAGNVYGLEGVTVGSGGTLRIESADPQVLQTAGAVVSGAAASAFDAANKVTDSQRAFVETASGQKSAVWIVGLSVAALIVPFLLKK